jgi:hypothetical protein
MVVPLLGYLMCRLLKPHRSKDPCMRFPGFAVVLISAIGLTGCIVEPPPRRPPPPPPLEYGRPPPPDYRGPPPSDYRPPPPDYRGPRNY